MGIFERVLAEDTRREEEGFNVTLSKSNGGAKIWTKIVMNGFNNYFVSTPMMPNYEIINFEELKKRFNGKLNENDSLVNKDLHNDKYLINSEVPFEGELFELPSGNYLITEIYMNGSPVQVLQERPNRTDGLEFVHDSYPELKNDLTLFLNNISLFKEMDSLASRKYLMFGPPGSGKTTLVRKLLSEMSDTITVYLDALPGSSIRKALTLDNRMKVFVAEELTTMMDSYREMKLMLEILDGEKSIEKSIWFATTNYPDKIPDNLIDRKGRFDLVIPIESLSPESNKQLMEKFLKREITSEELGYVKEFTIAEIKDCCLRSRLENITIKQYYKDLKDHKEKKNNAFQKLKKMGIGIGDD